VKICRVCEEEIQDVYYGEEKGKEVVFRKIEVEGQCFSCRIKRAIKQRELEEEKNKPRKP
jgi:hypothetical protein